MDYHKDMTSTSFEELVYNTLLPNFPEGSVIIMDNTLYHLEQLTKLLTINSNRKGIRELFQATDLYYEDHCIKKPLLDVRVMNSNFKKYYVDFKLRTANIPRDVYCRITRA
ncbi:hypothetical protein Trydic_g16023 [Trypoxylus dichotomus]